MDKTNDVILGVLGGPWCHFQYPGVEAYLVSIQRSGFSGRKVMICWDIRPDVRQKLLEFGFELVDVPAPYETGRLRGFFQARMRVCWEYLKDHYQDFRYVLWLDIKDLVLQSDPSVWIENNIGTKHIVASTECVTIEQEPTNQFWAKHILGEDKYQEIKDEEVINGGTWVGLSEAMKDVFHNVHMGCKDYDKADEPPCQIWINYVLRQPPFNEQLLIPRWSESFAACLHPVWWAGVREHCFPYLRDEYPEIDLKTVTLYPGTGSRTINSLLFSKEWRKAPAFSVIPIGDGVPNGLGIVTAPTRAPFVVVHGYDRDWGIKSLFDYKYRFDSLQKEYTLQELQDVWNIVAGPQRRALRLKRF
jgi:hypothetical protein